jgi:hypothetical protein
VYKVAFEDENFRVIAANCRKALATGTTLIALGRSSVMRAETRDGKSKHVHSKAGSAMAVPSTQSHHAETVAASDCQAVFVERK